MNQRSQTSDYVPPYPAFQAHQKGEHTHIAAALLAVQTRNGADSGPILAKLRGLLSAAGEGQPLHVEESLFDDNKGAQHHILMPYWLGPNEQAAFWSRGDITAFVEAPLNGDIGWMAEVFSAEVTSLDGNYSIPNVRYGISRYSHMEEEQYHAYMGSMRDRVPDYLSGKADGAIAQLALTPAPVYSLGKTIHITDLPHNLCFIRSGFAWKEAIQEEQDAYIADMLPVFQEAAQFLRDGALEANCISMRTSEEIHDVYDNGVQVNALGWFLNLQSLEKWTRDHPRHHAIMQTIMGYMARFNFQPKLNLGHEVIVSPKGQVFCIYANCHANTGFLPYFDGAVITG